MVAIERTHNRYKAKKVSIQESMVIGYPAMPVARQMNRLPVIPKEQSD
jgi:hypothetical protein